MEIEPRRGSLRLNEVIRVGPQSDRTGVLIGRDQSSLSLPSCALDDTVRRWSSTRKRTFTRNQSCWHLDLGLPASRTVTK